MKRSCSDQSHAQPIPDHPGSDQQYQFSVAPFDLAGSGAIEIASRAAGGDLACAALSPNHPYDSCLIRSLETPRPESCVMTVSKKRGVGCSRLAAAFRFALMLISGPLTEALHASGLGMYS